MDRSRRNKEWQVGGAISAVAVAAAVVVGCVAAQSGNDDAANRGSLARRSRELLRGAAAPLTLPPECAADAAPRPGNPPQHPAACHGNPDFAADGTAVATRGDVTSLPSPLKNMLTRLACRPHSTLPIQFFGEADEPSRLFQYYLLDTTRFEPNVFTSLISGVNETAQLTATGANCGLPAVAAVRMVLEPKPGLPTSPDDPRAFIDIITDISGLFVINNESGWYEGWMIHDLRVADVASPNPDGHARFGTITARDAARLVAMGSGNNVPGHFFTVDGRPPHFPSGSDHFPDHVTNVVPLQLSMGAYNGLQQSDVHQYWEFNYTTNWIHPLYELPFTGGFPDKRATDPADSYRDGEIGRLASVVPGEEIGLNRDKHRTIKFGDNPFLPRDPDKFDADVASQREFRQRFVPSAIAREAFLNAFERLDSFRPDLVNLEARLDEGYEAALAVADANHDGVISAGEGDVDTCNARCFPATPTATCPVSDSSCLYLSPTTYDRFAVTREINDGYLAPRFAPSQRAWVLAGDRVDVTPAVSASTGRDSDDR